MGREVDALDMREDRPLVGMVEAFLVPVDSVEAKEQGEADDEGQEHQVASGEEEPGGFRPKAAGVGAHCRHILAVGRG